MFLKYSLGKPAILLPLIVAFMESQEFALNLKCGNIDEIKSEIVNIITKEPMGFELFQDSGFHELVQSINPEFCLFDVWTDVIDNMITKLRSQRREQLPSKCDSKWGPFLYDLCIFPYEFSGQLYATVELIYTDIATQARRSCPLTCVRISPGPPKNIENVGAIEGITPVADCSLASDEKSKVRICLEDELLVSEESKVRKNPRLENELLTSSAISEAESVFLSPVLLQELTEVIVAEVDDTNATGSIMDVIVWGTKLLSLKTSLYDALKIAQSKKRAMEFLSYNKRMHPEEIGDFIHLSLTKCTSYLEAIKEKLEPETNVLTKPSKGIFKRHHQKMKPIVANLEQIIEMFASGIEIVRSDIENREYYVYDHRANSPPALLKMLPIHVYEKALQQISRELCIFLEMLCVACETPDNLQDERCLNHSAVASKYKFIPFVRHNIEKNQDGCQSSSAIRPLLKDVHEDIERLLKNGGNLVNEYVELCEQCEQFCNSNNEYVKTSYFEELRGFSEHFPADLSPLGTCWGKIALIRSITKWVKTESVENV